MRRFNWPMGYIAIYFVALFSFGSYAARPSVNYRFNEQAISPPVELPFSVPFSEGHKRAKLLETLGQQEKAKFAMHIQLADHYSANGDHASALKVLNEILVKSYAADEIDLRKIMISFDQVYVALGDHEARLEVLNTYRNAMPSNDPLFNAVAFTMIYGKRAEILLELGRHQQAKIALESAAQSLKAIGDTRDVRKETMAQLISQVSRIRLKLKDGPTNSEKKDFDPEEWRSLQRQGALTLQNLNRYLIGLRKEENVHSRSAILVKWAQSAASGQGVGRSPELVGRLVDEMTDLVRTVPLDEQTLEEIQSIPENWQAQYQRWWNGLGLTAQKKVQLTGKINALRDVLKKSLLKAKEKTQEASNALQRLEAETSALSSTEDLASVSAPRRSELETQILELDGQLDVLRPTLPPSLSPRLEKLKQNINDMMSRFDNVKELKKAPKNLETLTAEYARLKGFERATWLRFHFGLTIRQSAPFLRSTLQPGSIIAIAEIIQGDVSVTSKAIEELILLEDMKRSPLRVDA